MSKGWCEVITRRLILRPAEEEDALDLLVIFADRSVMIPNSMSLPLTDGDEMLSTVRQERLNAQYSEEPPMFVLERQIDGKVIGVIYFNSLRDGNGDIAYFIAAKYQGSGYMSEAMPVLLDHIFNHWSLSRLTASYAKENRISARLLQKHGFCKRKEHMQVLLNDHKVHTIITCDLQRSEWWKRRRNLDEKGIGTKI